MSGLTFDERWALWSDAQQTMTHFECQTDYGPEQGLVRQWLDNPDSVPSLRAAEPGFDSWCRLVESNRARGVEINRIRVYDSPLSGYQLFASAFAGENIAAGERIWMIPRAHALRLDLPVTPGNPDWWVIDGQHILVQEWQDGVLDKAHLHFDGHHLGWAERWTRIAMSNGEKMDG